MKLIRNFIIDTSNLVSTQTTRSLTVYGDPGAVFSIEVTNEDTSISGGTPYYNFDTTSFQSTKTRLLHKVMNSNGEYTTDILFPTVTDDDQYSINVWAESHFDTYHGYISRGITDSDVEANTKYSSSLKSKTIYQYIDLTATFSLGSSDTTCAGSSCYNTMPSNATITTSRDTKNTSTAISWEVSLSDNRFVIARQPILTDFETTIDATPTGLEILLDEANADYPGTVFKLNDITGLLVNMEVTTISGITLVKNASGGNPIITAIDGPTNTITIDVDQGGDVSVGAGFIFKGFGSEAIKAFYGTEFSISDFKVVISDVTTTTTSAVSSSTTVPVTSVDGLIHGDVVSAASIGINTSSTGTAPTISSIMGLDLTMSAAQTLEDGETITFTGSSRTATITGTVTLNSFGTKNFTTTFNLDNILTVS